MQIYPGYTVRRIEEELSYRELRELSQTWDKNRPMIVNLKIISEMIAGYFGIEIDTPKPTIEATKEAFKLLGF